MALYAIINRLVFIFLIAASFYSTDLKAQAISLDYFKAKEKTGEVFLKWAISKGNTCNGITITHSADSLFFSPIGRIEGVCGEFAAPQPYSFIDLNPLKNQKNFYKLELGTGSFSKVISINLIKKNEEGYQIRPQPIQAEASIYFDNPDFNLAQISIYNLNGQLIYQSTTKESYFRINSEVWPNGMMFFDILSEHAKIQGKILIAH